VAQVVAIGFNIGKNPKAKLIDEKTDIKTTFKGWFAKVLKKFKKLLNSLKPEIYTIWW
jgi:hypothetical protein